MSESIVAKQVRLGQESKAAELGRVIAGILPAGTGFVFVIYDFGPGNGTPFQNMSFISSGERAGTIALLRELATKMEGDA